MRLNVLTLMAVSLHTETMMPNLFLTRLHSNVEASVLDADKRLILLTFSSEEPVIRNGYDGKWTEVLGHDDTEADLSRLNDGAPLMRNHYQNIGVVDKAWINDGVGHAEVRLSLRKELDDFWQDIQDGIIRNVSVGYKILEKIEEVGETSTKYRVTKWLPLEISILDVPPADALPSVSGEWMIILQNAMNKNRI